MDALEFLGLEPTDDPAAWRLPLVPRICSGIGALFGGCGLAAAVAVLESHTQRHIVWSAAQYLSFATPPSVLDLRVTELVRGHQLSQAQLTATVDDATIFTVSAALGQRREQWAGDFAIMPTVPTPEACQPRKPAERWRNTFQSMMDARIANARELDALDGTPSDGHASLWVRVPDFDCGPASLAILGDYVPWGIGQALGQHVGGNSLDNTLRIVHRPTEADRDAWILVDVHVYAVADGFAHGRVNLWSRDGRLFATAGQSVVAREWDRPPAPRRVSGSRD